MATWLADHVLGAWFRYLAMVSAVLGMVGFLIAVLLTGYWVLVAAVATVVMALLSAAFDKAHKNKKIMGR